MQRRRRWFVVRLVVVPRQFLPARRVNLRVVVSDVRLDAHRLSCKTLNAVIITPSYINSAHLLTSDCGGQVERVRGGSIVHRLFADRNDVRSVDGLDGRHLDARGHVPAMGALRPFGRAHRRFVVTVHLSVHRLVVGQSAKSAQTATDSMRTNLGGIEEIRENKYYTITHCVEPVLLALCNDDVLVRGEDVPAQALTAILSALSWAMCRLSNSNCWLHLWFCSLRCWF